MKPLTTGSKVLLVLAAFLLSILDVSTTLILAGKYGAHLESNPRFLGVIYATSSVLILKTLIIAASFGLATILLYSMFAKINAKLGLTYALVFISYQLAVLASNVISFFSGHAYFNHQRILFPVIVIATVIAVAKKFLVKNYSTIKSSITVSYIITLSINHIQPLPNFEYFTIPLLINLVILLPFWKHKQES